MPAVALRARKREQPGAQAEATVQALDEQAGGDQGRPGGRRGFRLIAKQAAAVVEDMSCISVK
jgi:hypothetical protein